MEYIIRELEITRISSRSCTNFIQSIALCNATILNSFKLTNGFNESQVSYYSMFFTLGFKNQDDLDRFHSRGFDTTKPEQITGN